jgi:predicted ATPase/class 3 adenylate cyclase
MTVMFCDLADSTVLSTELDPEDLQDLIRAYQERCTNIIRAYEGFVAKYMGDGILVYFGYPKSLERNAERAVRSGLAIVEAMAELNAELERTKGVEIAVRIGIATGLVVVGEIIGEGLAQERTVIGEAPNMAARLQSVAPRNGIVIGGLTKEIVGDAFVYEDLGAQELKGVTGLVKVWAVLGLAADVEEEDGEKAAAAAVGRLPLVGRDEEIGLLRRAWQQTKEEGRGRVVLVVGEPGIGKSALVETLRVQVREEGLARIAFRCSPYHSGSALYPVIEHLRRLLRWQLEDSPETRLDKLEAMLAGTDLSLAEAVPLFASLLSLPLPEGRHPPLDPSPEQLKQQTQDALIAWTLEEAERRPMMEVWEDLHWADPSTLELLALLIEQAPTVPLLIVLTFRPEFLPGWPTRSHMTPITLTRLERPQIEMMVTHLAGGRTLPAEVLEHIVAKTDGVPLYIEELTKAILESGILAEEAKRFTLSGPLSAVTIPATLQESLMARLDRLPTVREVAQLGAVLGREFAYEMLRAMVAMEEPALRDILRQLVDAELLYQRGRPPRAKYIFKHALIQDAAYQSLLRQTRRHYHRQVAELLEERFAVSAGSQPEVLAHHFSEAGLHGKAAEYWRKAGEIAVRRSANVEAIAHFSNALEALKAQPEVPQRAEIELSLQVALAVPLIATKGYSDVGVERTYGRAQALCEQLGKSDELFPILRGLWNCYLTRGELQRTQDLAVRISTLAEARKEPLQRALAHRALGSTLFFLGRFAEALAQADQAIAIDDALEGSNGGRTDLFVYGERSGMVSRLFSGWALWFLGYPDRAVERFDAALALAERLTHAHSQAFALSFAASMRNNRRDFAAALEYADAAGRIAGKHNLPLWLGESSIAKGFAQASLGSYAEGIGQIRSGIAGLHRLGDWHHRSHWLGLLAAAHLEGRAYPEAATALDDAAALVGKSGECYYEAEIHRLRGELLLALSVDNQGEAENRFQQALMVSRKQQARSLELRAAMSLARLWQRQGKVAEARSLLAPVYGWFTEGLDTADLKEAEALLEELS